MNIEVPADIAIQVIDPKAYAADTPVHEAFRWLRANRPLGQARLEGIYPFWIVCKHADILEISRQNDLFTSGVMPTTFTSIEADERVRSMTGGSPHLVRTLVQMDAPDHPKHRVLTQSWFLPQNIRHLEDRIRQIARAHVDKMASLGGECDFVRDVALTYPLRVIMEILGVPPEDEPRMLRLTQGAAGFADPEPQLLQTNQRRARRRRHGTGRPPSGTSRTSSATSRASPTRARPGRDPTSPASSPMARSMAPRSTISRR